MISIRKLVWYLFCLVSSPSLKTKEATKKIKEDMPKPFPKDYELVRFWIHQILILSCIYQILNSPVLLNCKKTDMFVFQIFFPILHEGKWVIFCVNNRHSRMEIMNINVSKNEAVQLRSSCRPVFLYGMKQVKTGNVKKPFFDIGNIILVKSQEPLLGLHW